jgi:hypothetical protein
MSLNSQRKLSNTREKLALLQRMHAEASAEGEGDSEVRQAELESLQRQIKQLKEEIGRRGQSRPWLKFFLGFTMLCLFSYLRVRSSHTTDLVEIRRSEAVFNIILCRSSVALQYARVAKALVTQGWHFNIAHEPAWVARYIPEFAQNPNTIYSRTGLIGVLTLVPFSGTSDPSPLRQYVPVNARTVFIPIWLLLVLVLVYMLFQLKEIWLRHRATTRQRQGLCVVCGYDIRGQPAQCPECGTSIDPESRAQKRG